MTERTTYYGNRHIFTNRSSGSFINIKAGADEQLNITGITHIISDDDAINATTGSLVVYGGVGLEKSIYSGKNVTGQGNLYAPNAVSTLSKGINFQSTSNVTAKTFTNFNTQNSTSVTTGALTIASLTNTKNAFIGGSLSSAVTYPSTTGNITGPGGATFTSINNSGTSTFSGTVSGTASTLGGIAASKNIIVQGGATSAGSVTLSGSDVNTTLQVAGGMGVGGNVSAANLTCIGTISGNVGALTTSYRHIKYGDFAFFNTDLQNFGTVSYFDTSGTMDAGVYQICGTFEGYSALTLDKYFDFHVYYNGSSICKTTVHTVLSKQSRFAPVSIVVNLPDPSLLEFYTQSLTYNSGTSVYIDGMVIVKLY